MFFFSSKPVRLANSGGSILEGRVEIYHDNAWGTVCDNRWGMQDADVVCKQIGFQSAFKATGAAAFGEGTGSPILLDDVQCTGQEEGLRECYHRGWGQHVCEHSQDAGVICDEGKCNRRRQLLQNYIKGILRSNSLPVGW